MSGDSFRRREFFKKASALAAAGAAITLEERALIAYQERGGQEPERGGVGQFGERRGQPAIADVAGPIPTGNLGKFKVTRLIAGHNLVGLQAHSRDLIYTSQLLRAYFTDDKVLECYQKYEENGINTSMLRIESRNLMLAKKHTKERGGKLQWMAQIVVNEKDQTTDINLAAEAGVVLAHVRGLEGDRFFKSQQMDILAKTIENIKKAGMVAGMGSHGIDPIIQAEKLGLGADYYFKTFNSAQYWSASPAVPPDPNWKPTKDQFTQSEYAESNHNNMWETTPKATAEFFAKCKKPFVAYKVLAAGAIHPRDGFKYAFEKGADFVCAGMYDFQLKDDSNITKALLAGKLERTRPWIA
jgi:hypothetical protein